MLSAREKKLLTTYVDGECSAREAQQVTRLLRQSAEARVLLARLEEDAQTLRSMAALTIPIDLTPAIVAQAQAPRPTVAAPPAAHAAAPVEGFPVWRGVAAAAVILFLIGVASYWINSGAEPSRKAARRPDDPKGPNGKEGSLVQRPGPKVPGPRPPVPPAPPSEEPEWPWVPRPEVIDPEEDPVPVRPESSVITSGLLGPLQALERVTLALPVIHDVHRLDKPEAADKLLQQLTTLRGARLELLCRDATRGLERLQAALAAKKVVVTIDPSAQVRIKKKLIRSEYAVYLENLTPRELLALIQGAGVADRKAAEQKTAEGRYEGALVVKALGQADRKELMGLLGLDPVRSRPQARTRPAPVDITRPLSDLTGQQVGDALIGRGAPRPGAVRPAVQALILPLGGPRHRSAELKRYLDARTPEQADTLQVLIVLRQV